MTDSKNPYSCFSFFHGVKPVPGQPLCPKATHVLFDLDGTISLMRGGWSELMLSIFLSEIPRLPGESESKLSAMLSDDMMRQNGKPTVFQFIRFNERLKERGANLIEPESATEEFVCRLRLVTDRRRDAVLKGERSVESVLVPGTLKILSLLRDRGLELWLASGTDEKIVSPEMDELGLRKFFGDKIFSYRPGFSKVQVIQKIMSQQGMTAEQLVAFGDGYVEMNETAKIGGFPIAVASDESWIDVLPYQGSGRINSFKDSLLVEAGARMVIPDYSEAELLVNLIFGEKSNV